MARATLSSKPRLIRQVAASAIGAACDLAYGSMSPLLAQQQAPPPWTQGRPLEQASSPLAPHPQPPAPTPPKDIPVDKVKLSPGFKIEVWVDMLPNARSMTLGSKGTLFWAAVEMRFYAGAMFPPVYQNRIIIAPRGSWNRTQKSGFKLMQVELKPGLAPK